MKIGSHNSLTYKPTVWYQRLLHFTAKCQTVDYKKQYEEYGVRLFDLRIWFNDDFKIEVRHGIIKFKMNNDEINDFLKYLDNKGDCYLRIIFEETNINKTQTDIEYKEHLFKEWCNVVETTYKNIKFFGGNRKYDWYRLFTFGNKDEELIDLYSSTTSLFNSDNKFLRIIDDLYPWLYARLHNKKNFQKYKDEDKKWLFIDFVNIR